MAESKKSVCAAIAADAGIARSKFVAAGFSGSSGMLTEGIDTGIASLMLLGINRRTKPPDRKHPFGYSM
jgi:divalent metal cation (Fe/Co/Zn/Cd) transporter